MELCNFVASHTRARPLADVQSIFAIQLLEYCGLVGRRGHLHLRRGVCSNTQIPAIFAYYLYPRSQRPISDIDRWTWLAPALRIRSVDQFRFLLVAQPDAGVDLDENLPKGIHDCAIKVLESRKAMWIDNNFIIEITGVEHRIHTSGGTLSHHPYGSGPQMREEDRK
jgi:hypothetical protein